MGENSSAVDISGENRGDSGKLSSEDLGELSTFAEAGNILRLSGEAVGLLPGEGSTAAWSAELDSQLLRHAGT